MTHCIRGTRYLLEQRETQALEENGIILRSKEFELLGKGKLLDTERGRFFGIKSSFFEQEKVQWYFFVNRGTILIYSSLEKVPFSLKNVPF